MSVYVEPGRVTVALGQCRRMADFIQGPDWDRMMRHTGDDWILTTDQKDGRHFLIITDPKLRPVTR